MPVDVTTRTSIDRALEDVYAYASDPENAPKWYENIVSIEWVTEPPLRLGSKVTFVARFLGRTMKYTYEVTVFEPESVLVMRTSEGPFPMETTYLWESIAQSKTRMTLRNRGEPTGFSRYASPFVALAIRRANNHDLRRLRDLLEGSHRHGVED